VLDSLPPQIHRKCLCTLYRICGRQALLPKSLEISFCYDPSEPAIYRGGFADVWKGEYNGQEVSAKVLRVYLTGNLEKTRKVGCPQLPVHVN